ncbi:MAG TPA: gamma-glutamyl-gamma-aminobutyrate hydrolase family protein [Bdellovibrionales bacterium]|nr:gamma-glutamyl-gamma-aminobutyrate hydrolase family protein [Bdellovibrionales bacterium]
MKRSFVSLSFALLFLLLSSESFAAKLFVWQPTESSVPLILSREDDQSPQEAAVAYLAAFNENPGLVELSEGDLEIKLEGFMDFDPSQSQNPKLLVLTSEPQQFRGAKKAKSWFKMMTEEGADVYVLPVMHDAGLTESRGEEFRALLTENFDGILSLGGADVHTSLYNEPNREAEHTFLERDLSEAKVIKRFLDTETNACFGICRGAQLTSVVLGYRLHQDIAIETTNGHYHVAHDHPIVWLKVEDSILRKALKKYKTDYPSQHHQAVIAESNPGGQLTLVAAHDPGQGKTKIAEAFEYNNGRPGFLTQWHYERDKTNKGQVVMNLAYKELSRAQALRSCRAAVGE